MSARGGKKLGTIPRNNIMARAELERKGINPIDMLYEVFSESMKSYKAGRGYGEMGDAGTHYLAVAGKAAADLMKYYSPAFAPFQADMSQGIDDPDKKPVDAAQIILQDPFAKHAMDVAAKAKNIEPKPDLTPILSSGLKKE